MIESSQAQATATTSWSHRLARIASAATALAEVMDGGASGPGCFDASPLHNEERLIAMACKLSVLASDYLTEAQASVAPREPRRVAQESLDALAEAAMLAVRAQELHSLMACKVSDDLAAWTES